MNARFILENFPHLKMSPWIARLMAKFKFTEIGYHPTLGDHDDFLGIFYSASVDCYMVFYNDGLSSVCLQRLPRDGFTIFVCPPDWSEGKTLFQRSYADKGLNGAGYREKIYDHFNKKIADNRALKSQRQA